MKTNFLIALVAVATLFTSCAEDDTADIIINIDNGGGDNNTDGVMLSGNYSEDLTLDASETYVLNGPLIMASGTTLTIPAGMTIEAQQGNNVYIAISQGAKIDAQGTENNPIVLTSSQANPVAGDWGGLIILGKAPINSVAGGTATSTSEIASLPYGGNDTADNSGILNYVRVEYSGGAADGQTENNGISFYGVGNGTTVAYIQVHAGKDDGVEFFGGTVNVSNLIVTNSEDDSIDWTEGYSGTITDAYVKQTAGGDKGIEADGYNTDIGNNATSGFVSSPTVVNLTIENAETTLHGEAIRLRADTFATFINVYINGYEKGFKVVDDATGQAVLDGDLSVSDVTFMNVTTALTNDTNVVFTDADFIVGNGNGTATDVVTWGANWATNL